MTLKSKKTLSTSAQTLLAPILLLVVSLFSTSSHCEQAVKISESSISRKIHQPTITSIYTDRRGYLWIGTQHGLYKFDGSKLTVFNSDKKGLNWIPASDINAILEDKYGDIVIATFGGGLLKLTSINRSFEKANSNTAAGPIYFTHLVSTTEGEIWAGAKEGIFLFEKNLVQEAKWQKSDAHEQVTGDVSSITAGKAGAIYIATGSNLYISSHDAQSLAPAPWSLKDFQVTGTINALTFDNQNHLYVGTDNGDILVVDLTNNSLISKKNIGTGTSVSISRLLVQDEILWIGTSNGLYYADKLLSFMHLFRHDNSELSSDHITALSYGDGFIWVGTYQGLNTVSLVPFHTFDEQNSQVFDDVLAFAQDSKSRIWVGTYNGLFLFDDSEDVHINFKDWSGTSSIADERIMTLAARENEMWVGFHKTGVQVVDINSGMLSTPPIPDTENLEVTKILHAADGTTWVASYNRGLFAINGDQVTSFLADELLPEASVTILHELSSGVLLASSEHTIYQYDRAQGGFRALDINFGNSTHAPLILSISQSENQDIWIGTKDQGLFLWSHQDQVNQNLNVSQIDPDGETPLFTVYEVQFDSQGNAWCSTQEGIIKLDQGGQFLARFTSVDGLQGDDFNFGAAFTDSDGQIYFGGSSGYNRFNPLEVDIDTSPPRLLITSIDVSRDDGVASYDATNLLRLELTHKDYHVKFNLSVLDFLDPEKNQYRYKLDGYDREWIDNGTRNIANYTSLPAGNYTLRVQGANSAGMWNRDGLSLDVRVAPPPWLTWWAFCLYALALAILARIGFRAYYSYAVERRAAELAQEMHDTAEKADDEMQEQLEIQDELIKSVYLHNIATLELVSEVISTQSRFLSDDNARSAASSSIKRVNALALLENCLYHHNDGLLADLHKYTDIIISKLLEDAPVRAETIATINEVSSQLVMMELASPLAVTLYELLENAIQHAFDGSSPANYIHITLQMEQATGNAQSAYRLTVRDNGLGMPGNIDPHQAETSGLAIVAAMTRRLSGTVSFTTGDGTQVSLVFPYPESP